MSKVISEWDLVMQAYHKGNAMRLEEVKAARNRYGQVYATENDLCGNSKNI